MTRRPSRNQYFHAFEECEKYGIDEELLESVNDGQLDAIRALSRKLTKKIQTRRRSGRQTRLHKTIPPALCGFCAAVMVDTCRRISVPPPRELCNLLSVHLKVDAFGGKEVKHHDTRLRAALYLGTHPSASDTQIANYTGTSKQSVGQWKKDPSFLEFVEAAEYLAKHDLINFEKLDEV